MQGMEQKSMTPSNYYLKCKWYCLLHGIIFSRLMKKLQQMASGYHSNMFYLTYSQTIVFPFADLRFSFYLLIFGILITVCFGVVLIGLILFGTLCFLDPDVYFLFQIMEFSAIISIKFSTLFSLFSFWDPYLSNFCMLHAVPTFL